MQLGSTGDSFLMKFMRAKAKSMGMCLNEYAMGDKVSSQITSFKFLSDIVN